MIIPFAADASRKIVPMIIGGMVFLAVLSLALALSLMRLSHDWQADLVGGATVQIPAPSDLPREQIERHVKAVLDLLKNTPGVTRAAPVSEAETQSLLAPWFGDTAWESRNPHRQSQGTESQGTESRVTESGGKKLPKGESLRLGGWNANPNDPATNTGDWFDLPIPRLVDVTIDPTQFDAEKFRQNLAAKVPGASFDDHLSWLGGLLTLANSLQILAILVLILVGGVAMLTVAFATHSGMEIHRDVIQVLHMMGAQDKFIAANFVRYQAGLALKGALGGGGLGLVVILGLSLAQSRLFPGIGLDFGPSWFGFVGILSIIPLMVGLTSLTAWRTALRLLQRLA
ncbi:MAG: hypothetical protein QM537_02940 [Candidatus Symbiobacter sp.]|nr:hypothetical protein [Candidatus Symbiobacter sp.]